MKIKLEFDIYELRELLFSAAKREASKHGYVRPENLRIFLADQYEEIPLDKLECRLVVESYIGEDSLEEDESEETSGC